MRYAVVRDSDSEVENVIEWDGQTEWSPPLGTSANQSDEASPGDRWSTTGGLVKRPLEPPTLDPEWDTLTTDGKLDRLARQAGFSTVEGR